MRVKHDSHYGSPTSSICMTECRLIFKFNSLMNHGIIKCSTEMQNLQEHYDTYLFLLFNINIYLPIPSFACMYQLQNSPKQPPERCILAIPSLHLLVNRCEVRLDYTYMSICIFVLLWIVCWSYLDVCVIFWNVSLFSNKEGCKCFGRYVFY